MPKEDRLITFDYQEVYQAIFTLCKQKDMRAPPYGAIIHIGNPNDDTSRIELELYDKTQDDTRMQEYSRDFVAAALMMYCRGLGIPLPKTASKTLTLMRDEVGLRVRIDK